VNLLSQGHSDENGYLITTGSSKATFFHPLTPSLECDIWTEAPQIGYLYWPTIKFIPLSPNCNIDLDPSPFILDSFDAIPDTAAYPHVPLMAELWRACLGHANKVYTSVMLGGCYATGICVPYPSLTTSFNWELSLVTLSQNGLNSDSEFISVVLNPNITIFNTGCTLSRDRSILHVYSAQQAMDITATHCGVLTTLARGDKCILFCSPVGDF
jgi:hypothetical protein